MSAADLSPRARLDLLKAAAWIAKDNPQAARALGAAVDRAAALIGQFPQVGRARPMLAPAPVRFLVLRGFPYVVVYDPEPGPPLILRVLHGARDLAEVLRDLTAGRGRQ